MGEFHSPLQVAGWVEVKSGLRIASIIQKLWLQEGTFCQV